MEANHTCRVCGASLAPDAEWCGQCLTPVGAHATSEPPPGQQGSAHPAGAEVAGSDTAGFRSGTDEDAGGSAPEVYAAPEVSVFKPGPYQFGLLGRLVWTGVFVAGGLGLFAASQAAGEFYGRPALALVLVLLGVYLVIGLIFLWGVWRPTRVK